MQSVSDGAMTLLASPASQPVSQLHLRADMRLAQPGIPVLYTVCTCRSTFCFISQLPCKVRLPLC